MFLDLAQEDSAASCAPSQPGAPGRRPTSRPIQRRQDLGDDAAESKQKKRMSSSYEIGMEGKQRFLRQLLRRLAEEFASHEPFVLEQGPSPSRPRPRTAIMSRGGRVYDVVDFDRPDVRKIVTLLPPPTNPGSMFVVSSDGTVVEHRTQYLVYKVYPREE